MLVPTPSHQGPGRAGEVDRVADKKITPKAAAGKKSSETKAAATRVTKKKTAKKTAMKRH